MRTLITALHIICALFVFSCVSRDGSSLSAYRQWMGDERHGVMVSRQIGDVRLKLQWLPPELLV
jgi:hypothetical protein